MESGGPQGSQRKRQRKESKKKKRRNSPSLAHLIGKGQGVVTAFPPLAPCGMGQGIITAYPPLALPLLQRARGLTPLAPHCLFLWKGLGGRHHLPSPHPYCWPVWPSPFLVVSVVFGPSGIYFIVLGFFFGIGSFLPF